MIVFTLDAGGTNFVFSIVRDGDFVGAKVKLPAHGDNLQLCLQNIIGGFERLQSDTGMRPDAISFAFPGPADFAHGIIGDLYNLPAFRGGVALGKMLEQHFGVPVFINNDGDLYAYGEALCGTLPLVNSELKKHNSHKRYRNLVGMTIGTGFGAGIVHDNILLRGDNMCAAEIWVTSNRVDPDLNSEEGVSIRAVRHFYAAAANIDPAQAPTPEDIYNIGIGTKAGNQQAAQAAFAKLGRFIGDAIANMITLTDGLVVVGGGVSGAKELIIPGIEQELAHGFNKINGGRNPRLAQKVFCLNDERQFANFVEDHAVVIKVPYSNTTLHYDPQPRCGYMFSCFNTSDMISLGAYHIVNAAAAL